MFKTGKDLFVERNNHGPGEALRLERKFLGDMTALDPKCWVCVKIVDTFENRMITINDQDLSWFYRIMKLISFQPRSLGSSKISNHKK